jgi:hypothetical protein
MVMSNFSELEIASIVSVKTKLYSDFGGLLGMMPKDLQKLILEHGVITGGSISSLFHNTTPNDWDVYLDAEDALAEFNKMIGDNGPVNRMIAMANPNYRQFETTDGKMITENAVTFQNGIQVITKTTAELARAHFDFIHCMPYYALSEKKFYISREQFDSIKNKKIIPNKNFRGRVLVARVHKYKERGWVGP